MSQSENVLIDSSSNMGEHSLRVYMLCMNSVAWALPLGLIITWNEQLHTLIMALCLFKSILLPHPFFGLAEPAEFMSDNYSEIREALIEIFPTFLQLLCVISHPSTSVALQ